MSEFFRTRYQVATVDAKHNGGTHFCTRYRNPQSIIDSDTIYTDIDNSYDSAPLQPNYRQNVTKECFEFVQLGERCVFKVYSRVPDPVGSEFLAFLTRIR